MLVSYLLVDFKSTRWFQRRYSWTFFKREITWKWSKIMRKICLALDMLILCTECALFGNRCAFFRESANWHRLLVFAIGSLLLSTPTPDRFSTLTPDRLTPGRLSTGRTFFTSSWSRSDFRLSPVLPPAECQTESILQLRKFLFTFLIYYHL